MTSDKYSMKDDKDWTWVLEAPCSDCGFEAADYPNAVVADALRQQVDHYVSAASSPLVGRRPSADVWSAHEYICHVRDVYELYSTRLDLMLNEDNPLYPNWDQDETAAAENYADQDLATALADLVANGQKLADQFASLSGDQWERPGRRSDGAAFTIESFCRYLVHDPHHHLNDIANGYHALS